MTATSPLPIGRSTTRPSREGGAYIVDASRSFVQVRMRRLGVPLEGRFDVDGTIEMADDLRSTAVDLAIAPDSFHGIGGRGRRRLAGRLGQPARARVTFVADGMEPILESFVTFDGDRPLWALVGHLAVDGAARPLRIAVSLLRSTAEGAGLQLSGTAAVRRMDLGIGGRGISDVIHVRVSLVAYRDRM